MICVYFSRYDCVICMVSMYGWRDVKDGVWNNELFNVLRNGDMCWYYKWFYMVCIKFGRNKYVEY
jgi:hypothetical protein